MTDTYDAQTPMSPVTEEKPFTAQRVRESWDKSMKATAKERQQATLNQCFLLNQHWNTWNRASGRLEELPRNPDRVRATVAKVGPDSNRILAKLCSRPLVWEVPPKSADDVAIQSSRVAEAAVAEAALEHGWEEIRYEHSQVTWTGGVGAIAVEWDTSIGDVIGVDEEGREIRTGDVRLSVHSMHEIGVEPGTKDVRKGRWWISGVACPSETVKEDYGLSKVPSADARMVDAVWSSQSAGNSNTPMTMVYTYYERPYMGRPGRVATIIDDQIVNDGPWPFPFTDRLNIGICKVVPIHGKWLGHTPVTDAVPVQTAFNASWSSIIEHMKQAGNARMWVPYGSVEDIEDLSDLAGEAAHYNPINGMRPQYESPPSMPDWWIRQPDMLGQQMDNILGQKEVSRGGAPGGGVDSGIAISILAENDDTMIGRFGRNMADMWGDVASMVLEIYEARVRESRTAMVQMPNSRIPEVVKWNGESLNGHTRAYVPTDAVAPRNRSAQQAYAFQLYDRGIIKTPQELAKVADLPDSDDLLQGIDPDTSRASRENAGLASGQARTVDVIDDHQNHIFLHRNFMRSERYEQLDPQIQQTIRDHVTAHEIYAAEQAAKQAYAAGVSPMAASLPTEETSVLGQEQLAAAAQMGNMAPAAGTEEMPEEELPEEEEPQ